MCQRPCRYLLSYRVEIARSFRPQVDHVARDAQHGGQAHTPTEEVRPPRIFVIHVLYWRVFDDVETEDTLKINQ